MNDTTLPINSNSKSKTKTTTRKKSALRKGFALHDWKRLLQVSTDLAQRKGQPIRQITMKEIRLHDKIHDGWISLFGKVYNIGPYLHYHPGGVEIFEGCLGGDASSLFEEYHRWVNIDNLIGPLLLGYLESDDEDLDSSDKESNLLYGINTCSMDNKGLPTALTKSANGTTLVSDFSMPPPKPVLLPKSLPSLLKSKDIHGDENDVDLNPWEKTN